MPKKLQESKGSVSLGKLSEYIKSNVMQKSVVINHKSQTPNTTFSAAMSSSWSSLKLK